MKIVIDNSADVPVFYLNKNNRWKREAVKAALKKPLLARLESVLKKYKCGFHDLDGIAVMVGCGRFTAMRVAATMGNGLAFALNIPIIGVRGLDFKRIERSFKLAKPGRYVSAEYSGAVHIGGKKSKI